MIDKQKKAARWQRWHAKNKEQRKEYLREYRAENRERITKATQEWFRKNREKQRGYSQKFRDEQPERYREIQKQSGARHKGARNARDMKRAAQKRKATPPWLNKAHFAEIRKIYEEASAINYHVDHIIPLRGVNVSGLHVPWNLQLLPPSENLRKGNRI